MAGARALSVKPRGPGRMAAALLLCASWSAGARGASPAPALVRGQSPQDSAAVTPPAQGSGADPALTASPPLDDASFAELHAALVPEGPSTFEAIPWRVDLDAARQEAGRLGRPLFLWSMNGHPLGCT